MDPGQVWASLAALLLTLQGPQGHRPVLVKVRCSRGSVRLRAVYPGRQVVELSAPANLVITAAPATADPSCPPSPHRPPPLGERILGVLARQVKPIKVRTIANELHLSPSSSHVAAGVAELVRAGKVIAHAGHKYSLPK